MDFSLLYFANDSGAVDTDRYSLLLDGACFADEHEFTAVWTPERHFHPFGGLYPNPAVVSAALAMSTRRIAIRAGSVVARSSGRGRTPRLSRCDGHGLPLAVQGSGGGVTRLWNSPRGSRVALAAPFGGSRRPTSSDAGMRERLPFAP
ncbi:LLM class flavin-dependent oxidoreductase [Stackebrandtia soli]|uniref:LLM class flavin-dependent oxidoreductase n=1 Tax=Stackebrandtia soli TaxID=1892856 RepID=UPI0039E92F67